MKYSLIKNSRNDINQFLKTVLENRGISEEDYEEFLASNNVDIEGNTYDNLNNIQEGIKTIWQHIENNDIITLVVDPDVDGICSSAILFDYLEKAVAEVLQPQGFATTNLTIKSQFYINSRRKRTRINTRHIYKSKNKINYSPRWRK